MHWHPMADDSSGGPDSGGRSAWAEQTLESEQLDDWFDLLRDRTCRFVLYRLVLADADALTIGELGDWLAEHDVGPERPDRVELELHHATIPRLADAGVVNYDPRSGTVRRRREALRADLLRHVGCLEADVPFHGSDVE